MAKIPIRKLREKLDALGASGKTQPLHKDIATRLGITKTTLSGHVAASSVPDGYLPTLFELLKAQASVAIDTQQAQALWFGDIDDFITVLVQAPSAELNDVLRACTETFAIQLHPASDRLCLDEEAVEMDGEAYRIKDGTAFHLSAPCRLSRRLLILSEYASGLQVLAPGKLHSGEISALPVIFPHDIALTFRANYGPRRYIFIEHEPGFVPNLVASGDLRTLDDNARSRFARQLKMAKGRWRWGQAWLIEDTSSSPSSGAPSGGHREPQRSGKL